jgi:hypothetical protein
MKRWLVGMTVLGLACGSDSSGPGAASVTGIAGDNQSAPRGAPLPAPLSFTALGSDGLPVAGISVTWSATPAGGAVFTPAATTTDSNGVASTNVVLGTAIGTITMQANLAGVSPVTYHATALDPCATYTPYAIGDTVSAALSGTDCLRGQWFYDFYIVNFPSPAQQSFRVSMHGSGTFEDTFLDLYTFASGQIVQILAFDDDSILGQTGARNSQIDIIVPGDTTFVIGANSFDPFAVGNYTVTSENRPAALNGCRAVWVTRGISVTDSITAADCADSSAPPKYYHVARIVAFSPTVLTLSMKSTTLNPSLYLYQLNAVSYERTLVAQNDDSLPGTNTNAFVRYPVPVNNFYDIVIGTSASGETGDFTFEVSAATTLSPPAVPGSASSASGWKSWWRDVGLPKRSRS